MSNTRSKELIASMANYLNESDTYMSGGEAADYLNRNGARTSYGEEYKGGRGTYTAIGATYDYLMEQGREEEAHNVATRFTKDNAWGEYEELDDDEYYDDEYYDDEE